MHRPGLLIRADASSEMGTGHAMRCLALAQAWQDVGGSALAACALLTPALEARLLAEGIAVSHLGVAPGSQEDAAQTLALAREAGAAWLVVDGYHFGDGYQQAVAQAGLRQLLLDDYGHAGYYWASLVLNQNLSAHEPLYTRREPATDLLLGTGYALLRREFSPWRGWLRQTAMAARRVLVTLGGSDAGNATLQVLEALRLLGLPDLEVKVVVGGSSPHAGALRRAAQASGLCLELVENCSDMPELMAWADVAVSAAGTTSWELAFMQLPALVLILAENQQGNAEELDRVGAAVNLGWYADAAPAHVADTLRRLLADGAAREAMARQGGRLVDGRGAERVAALLAGAQVRARPAVQEDCGLLLEWANDPLTRSMSFHPQRILPEEHKRWFERVTGDPDTLLLVAEARDAGSWSAAGQVRFDADGTVSLGLAPRFRRRRLAAAVLRTAVAVARARTPGRQLVAYVKPENEASHRAFAQAAFLSAGPAEVQGQPCIRYVYG